MVSCFSVVRFTFAVLRRSVYVVCSTFYDVRFTVLRGGQFVLFVLFVYSSFLLGLLVD